MSAREPDETGVSALGRIIPGLHCSALCLGAEGLNQPSRLLGEGPAAGSTTSPPRSPETGARAATTRKVESGAEPPSAGTLYGVGVGPGDPELITVKGLRLLRAAAVVFLPVREEGRESYAGIIAAEYLDPTRQEIVPLVYPSRRGERDRGRWDANADAIAARLRGGRQGVFLTEGDPLLYSTFIHALQPLRTRHPELAVGVVPGIWSGSAAAAALAEPLVVADERLAVLPATYAGPELGAVLRAYDTVVLLKPGADREALRRVIADAGAEAVWVQRVGRPEQRISRDLATLPPHDYFSLLIVRGGRHRVGAANTPEEAAGQ